ncbi:MAG: hypothetical protein ABSG91_23325 [Syntrophobacteraceae bacterium]
MGQPRIGSGDPIGRRRGPENLEETLNSGSVSRLWIPAQKHCRDDVPPE